MTRKGHVNGAQDQIAARHSVEYQRG
jgi:hypothetical protein